MTWCQASRCYTIVAGDAIIGNTCMIKHRWYKGTTGHMADVAIFIGCHMGWIGLRILAGCIEPIVAGITPFTHNVGSIMVDKCAEESSRVMAGSTIFIGVLMKYCIRRASGTNRNVIYTTIVAGGTVISDARVRKNRGKEFSNHMTKVAVLNRRQMACRLDDIRITVSGRKELTDMTTFATLGLDRVHSIHKCCRRCKTTRRSVFVADKALVQCRDMIWQFACSANGNMVWIATMAGFTIASDIRVRKVRRVLEWSRAAANGRMSVAGRTILSCRQVINCFAGTDITVMTRHAVTRNSSMIKRCW